MVVASSRRAASGRLLVRVRARVSVRVRVRVRVRLGLGSGSGLGLDRVRLRVGRHPGGKHDADVHRLPTRVVLDVRSAPG